MKLTYKELESKCAWEKKTRQKLLSKKNKLLKELNEVKKAFEILKSVFSK